MGNGETDSKNVLFTGPPHFAQTRGRLRHSHRPESRHEDWPEMLMRVSLMCMETNRQQYVQIERARFYGDSVIVYLSLPQLAERLYHEVR